MLSRPAAGSQLRAPYTHALQFVCSRRRRGTQVVDYLVRSQLLAPCAWRTEQWRDMLHLFRNMNRPPRVAFSFCFCSAAGAQPSPGPLLESALLPRRTYGSRFGQVPDNTTDWADVAGSKRVGPVLGTECITVNDNKIVIVEESDLFGLCPARPGPPDSCSH